MKNTRLIAVGLMVILPIMVFAQHCGGCPEGSRKPTPAKQTEATWLQAKDAGKPYSIDKSYTFEWEFSKSPKIGNNTLIVRVSKDGKRVSEGVEIFGSADMPSMKGAHSTGDIALKTNKKGDFLLPVSFVMLGDWEISLTFKSADKTINKANIPVSIK